MVAAVRMYVLVCDRVFERGFAQDLEQHSTALEWRCNISAAHLLIVVFQLL